MALDQTDAPSSSNAESSSMIENEIPAYRAISASAVWSLILGLVSLFCFAHLSFLLASAGAILLGVVAIKKIKKFPEILTGQGFAKAGIVLGCLFAGSSIAREVTTNLEINYEGGQFAQKYVSVLKDEPLSVAAHLMQPATYRAVKSPDDIITEMKKATQPGKPDVFLEKTGAIQAIKKRLKGEGQTIKYSKIEGKTYDGLTIYANALIELDGPEGVKDIPHEEFALLMMVKPPGSGRADWYVKDIKFPYTPMSASVEVVHKVDDGHGH